MVGGVGVVVEGWRGEDGGVMMRLSSETLGGAHHRCEAILSENSEHPKHQRAAGLTIDHRRIQEAK